MRRPRRRPARVPPTTAPDSRSTPLRRRCRAPCIDLRGSGTRLASTSSDSEPSVPSVTSLEEPRTASQVLGRTLNDRYRVVEPISAGAMGAVYRAVDQENGHEVALKQSTNPHH